MSWLNFANHFLLNQRLHVWSWINRTFSGMVFIFCGKFGFECLGLFLLCFCLVRGEKVASAQDFGWWSKGEDHFKSWFPFFSCLLVTILCCSDIFLVQRPFCIFLLFSSDLWSGTFLFLLFSSDLWSITFFLFFFLFLKQVNNSTVSDPSFLGDPTIPFSEGKNGNSHLGSRFMVSWDFGSRLVE